MTSELGINELTRTRLSALWLHNFRHNPYHHIPCPGMKGFKVPNSQSPCQGVFSFLALQNPFKILFIIYAVNAIIELLCAHCALNCGPHFKSSKSESHLSINSPLCLVKANLESFYCAVQARLYDMSTEEK